MESTQGRVLQELQPPGNSNLPEGIGVAEDSGFASIGGASTDDASKERNVGGEIKFRTIDVEQMAHLRAQKRKMPTPEEEAHKKAVEEEKRKAIEEYNNEKREHTYKSLMHLLNKSQFYSSYIMGKIDGELEKKDKPKKKGGRKKKAPATNENKQPTKKSQRVTRAPKRYDLSKFVSTDMQKKIDAQKKKMNLSEEDIAAELNSQSDDDDKEDLKSSGEEFVTPEYFIGELRDYQQVGLRWLKVLYENGVNGILADEMGLGKTIQVIALFCYLIEKRQAGPYLVIAPLSTIPNWLSEFKRFAPQLPVYLLHGPAENRVDAMKQMNRKHRITENFSTFPILLTTFEIPMKEQTFFRRIRWHYLVIDEAQRIKNYKCQLIGLLKQCHSMNRLLLTGTPLQNDLSELWSLLNFLSPELFNKLSVFEEWFSATELQEADGTEKVLQQEQDKQVLSTLREILKPFMLRRLKTDVCLDIPPKKEMIVYAPLTQLQYELYSAVLNHDLMVLSRMTEAPPPALDESTGRPKRRCTSRNILSRDYVDIYAPNTSGSSSFIDSVDDDSHWPAIAQTLEATASKSEISNLTRWQQYTHISERNQAFFIRLRCGNRTSMYKQIVNHPYLLHCPLDEVGLPEISEEMVKASGKLMVLDAMLTKLKAQGHKILLFSTMVMIIDLIADYLSLRPWKFLMLCGRDSIEARQENIRLFNEDPDQFLFLISTRAGGVGLNLAAADTVIVYDSDWNPQADIQAMARCHRIGQTRPVVIYKLCTKGTVDERIMSRAEAKRKLEKMVMSKDLKVDVLNPIALLELKRLLDSTDCTVVTAEKDVYTEEELDKILDRSDLEWPLTQAKMKAESD